MKTTTARADRGPAAQPTVLILGGTGRTGRLVVEQLLGRGATVRAIVRSADRLPSGCADDANLQVIEADILSLSDDELRRHLRGCDAVVSCLGHPNNLKGVFGPPYDLVTPVARRLHAAAQALHPERPVKFVLMSSVSVNHPGGLDPRRGPLEGATLGFLRALVPPAQDNQRAADFLCREVGAACGEMEWVAVRPDSLLDGDVAQITPGYALHRTLVTSLFRPNSTSRANVARFMCDLACDAQAWQQWKGELPVIVNDRAACSLGSGAAARRRAA